VIESIGFQITEIQNVDDNPETERCVAECRTARRRDMECLAKRALVGYLAMPTMSRELEVC
jgi:hypothetical protein